MLSLINNNNNIWYGTMINMKSNFVSFKVIYVMYHNFIIKENKFFIIHYSFFIILIFIH